MSIEATKAIRRPARAVHGLDAPYAVKPTGSTSRSTSDATSAVTSDCRRRWPSTSAASRQFRTPSATAHPSPPGCVSRRNRADTRRSPSATTVEASILHRYLMATASPTMRDRVGAFGGQLAIESSAGVGTTVRGWLKAGTEHPPFRPHRSGRRVPSGGRPHDRRRHSASRRRTCIRTKMRASVVSWSGSTFGSW